MMKRMHTAILLALSVAAFIAGCAPRRPPRYVIERDLGAFFYRRYQRTLDVEFAIEGNPAVGHTATYLRRGPGAMAFGTAFVTVYERADALSAEVRERLQDLQRYRFAIEEVAGEHTFALSSGDQERWFFWVSGRHVIKLGAPPGEPLPDAIAEAYMDAYPSDLDEHGRARDDAQSRGRSRRESQREKASEPAIPRSLRPNAPR
jgi:hypothetical protein